MGILSNALQGTNQAISWTQLQLQQHCQQAINEQQQAPLTPRRNANTSQQQQLYQQRQQQPQPLTPQQQQQQQSQTPKQQQQRQQQQPINLQWPPQQQPQQQQPPNNQGGLDWNTPFKRNDDMNGAPPMPDMRSANAAQSSPLMQQQK